MKNLNLYEISTEFEALTELLEAEQGEVTESYAELEQQVQALLLDKTDGLVSYVQKLQDDIEVAKAHIKRIQEWKKVRENTIERLKSYTAECMTKIDKKKVQGTLGEVAVRKPVKQVQVDDERLIPAEYLKVVTTVDKVKLGKALKDGEEIEGARLMDGKKSVQFKMKSLSTKGE